MDYAEAVNRFNDDISSAAARAENAGLTMSEIIKELRRIANEFEAEAMPNRGSGGRRRASRAGGTARKATR
jgi:hypothetical protein